MKTNVHVSNNSGNNEWYTPLYILEPVRIALGCINIDPCSNPTAQQLVQADVYYTKDNSSLDKNWHGNVWMNPPYSASLIKQFCSKLASEYKEGNTTAFITLTNNATETQWFKELYAVSDVFCFLTKRVKFLDANLVPANTPLQGQVLSMQGSKEQQDKFIKGFNHLGLILKK